MVGFAVFGRIEVYDSPVIFQLLENGKRKRIHQKREKQENFTYALEECQGDNGKLGAAVIHCITIICHDCLYDHESLAIKRQ